MATNVNNIESEPVMALIKSTSDQSQQWLLKNAVQTEPVMAANEHSIQTEPVMASNENQCQNRASDGYW